MRDFYKVSQSRNHSKSIAITALSLLSSRKLQQVLEVNGDLSTLTHDEPSAATL